MWLLKREVESIGSCVSGGEFVVGSRLFAKKRFLIEIKHDQSLQIASFGGRRTGTPPKKVTKQKAREQEV